jgi:hypothetical protein
VIAKPVAVKGMPTEVAEAMGLVQAGAGDGDMRQAIGAAGEPLRRGRPGERMTMAGNVLLGKGVVLEMSSRAMRKRCVCEVPAGKMAASEAHAAEMAKTATPKAAAEVSAEARFGGAGPQ